MTLTANVGAATGGGRLRSANEDSHLVREDVGIFAVADGMGGHRAGDVASSTALEAFETRCSDGDDLVEAIKAANTAVWEKAQANPEMRGMGTTVTAFEFDGRRAHIGHVGDSRAYLLRDGELTRVTDDHSLVEELVRDGRLTPEQAAVHPQRSIITRALGVDDDVAVDTYDVDLRSGDRLLLCSDGLTSMLSEERIAEIARRESDAGSAAQALVDAANEAGGEDNITVVVVDFEGDDDDRARAASRAVELAPEIEATGEWERPDDLAPEEPEPEPAPSARRGVPWKRLALFVVPVVLISVVAVAALGWYARRTYFVGIDDDRVVLFQGVPDGFLGWDPTVEEVTDLHTDDLTPSDFEDLQDGHRFSSRTRAEAFIDQLDRKIARSTTTTTGVTSTTALVAPSTTR